MKEILVAVISFTVSAIIISLSMTVVGNFIAPDTNLAASYDATSPKAVPENQQAKTKEFVYMEKEKSSERLIALADTKSPVPTETNTVEPALTDTQKSKADADVAETRTVATDDAVVSETTPNKETLEKVTNTELPVKAPEKIADIAIPDVKLPDAVSPVTKPEQAVEATKQAVKKAAEKMVEDSATAIEEMTKKVTDDAKADIGEALAKPEEAVEEITEESVSDEESPEEISTSEKEEEILEETLTPEPELISETPLEEPSEQNAVIPAEEPKKEAVSEAIPAESPEEKPEISPNESQKATEDVSVSEKPEPDITEEIAEEEAKPALKTDEEIKQLTKSLKNGEKVDLGDGRIAYKVKGGDTFSQICQKVIGTSSTWKDEAKKMKIDYRKIYPGMVLFFEK